MFHMYDFVGMILPLMAASDSCAGRAGITGAWWGGKGGTAASGDWEGGKTLCACQGSAWAHQRFQGMAGAGVSKQPVRNNYF